jgi:signal transduction histidine kinase
LSLRRKFLLIFVLVNLVTFGVLGFYAWRAGERARTLFTQVRGLANRRATAAIEGLLARMDEVIDTEIAGILEKRPNDVELPLLIRENPSFDSKLFRSLVEKAVLVRLGEGEVEGAPRAEGRTTSWFNLKKRYIFDHGTLDKGKALRLVVQSLQANRRVVSSDEGRIAGPLMSGDRPWGGFYIDLSPLVTDQPGEEEDPSLPVRHLLLIVGPSTLLLLGLLWVFLSRRVFEPLEELGQVARSVSSGDYSRRLPVTARRDEIGRLGLVVNRMLELVEEYHQELEHRIGQKTAELERKNQELLIGQSLAATGALASGIAHEINNPLGGMLNALQRLKRSDLNEEQRRRYESLVEDGIERIGNIVRQVLSLSPHKTVPSLQDVPEALRRAADLVAHRAAQRDVEIVTQIDDDLPPVLGESHELGQIFLNLLINAIDACYDGGRVQVRAHRHEGRVCVEVRDWGSGMSPDVAARAFDRFFTTKEEGVGTGLGLATVHTLVEAHGGTIDLWTEPGKGTRITVKFPEHPVEDRSDG